MIGIHTKILKRTTDIRENRFGGAAKETPMERIEMAGHLIRRLHQQSTQVFLSRTHDAGFDLTSVQFAALDAIAQQPSIDQSNLAATISFDRATIGGVVDRLESKGLVERAVSAQDRRARQLRLTPEGKKLLARIRPVVEALQSEILAPLTRTERVTFLALARKALGLG
jgi:MarR family transcriptional regulator, temperature-dependent positive regulator of motility